MDKQGCVAGVAGTVLLIAAGDHWAGFAVAVALLIYSQWRFFPSKEADRAPRPGEGADRGGQ